MLLVLVVLVYLPALQSPFTYDDKIEVVGNPTIRALTDWRAVAAYNWSRPLLIASYALNWAWGGLDPLGYHVVSLGIHLVNVGLAGWLGARLLGERGWWAAAIWAVHPMATQGVTYITGRSDALCATAWLVGLVAVLTRRRGLVVLSVAAGLLTKEIAFTLPIVLLLAHRLPAMGEGRPASEVVTPGSSRLGVVLLGLVGGAALVRLAMYGWPRGELPRGLLDHGSSQAEAWADYLRLWLVPVGQSIIHPHPGVVTWAGGAAALGVGGGLIGLLLAARRGGERAQLRLFCALFAALWLLPSSAVPLKEVMAEHRSYLAGFALLLGLATLLPDTRRIWPWLTGALLGAAGLTLVRNDVWKSEISLWAEAARRYPDDAEAAFGHGDALRLAREWASAEAELKRSITLDPTYDDAWVNLGIVLAEQGRADEAEAAWRDALRVNPKACAAQNNLAGLEMQRGSRFRAISAYQRTLDACPNDPIAHLHLGNLAWDAGQMREAAFHLRVFVAVAPTHPLAEAARQKLSRLAQ